MLYIDFNYDSSLLHENGQSLRIGGGSTWQNPSYVREQIRPIVAREMGCRDPRDRPLTYAPGQIKFRSFDLLPYSGDGLPDFGDDALVLMYVCGFNWPDLMSNLDVRLEKIGDAVAALLDLPGGTVDVIFIELRHPSKTQRAGRVRV